MENKNGRVTVEQIILTNALFVSTKEIRSLFGKWNASGIFRNAEDTLKAYGDFKYKAKPEAQWYFTINPLKEEMYYKVQGGRFMTGYDLPKSGAMCGDEDIARLCDLFIDGDPIREPKGISTTDEEHELAHKKIKEIREFLAALGWKYLCYADSGNGAHVHYRIDLENTPENVELIRRCLLALAAKFTDDRVDIDTGNFNPSRICKLYGTVAHKGNNTPERPHREAKILEYDETRPVNSIELVRQLAAMAPADDAPADDPQPAGKTDTKDGKPAKKKSEKKKRNLAVEPDDRPDGFKFEFLAFAEKHDIEHGPGKDYTSDDGKHGLLYEVECPFFPEDHAGGARVFQFDDGTAGFICHGGRCHGKKHLRDYILHYEPDYDFPMWTPPDAIFFAVNPSTGGKGTFLHEKLGQYMIENMNIAKINGTVHIYKDGVYCSDPDIISGCMIDIVPHITERQRKEVFKYLQAYSGTPVLKPAAPEKIPFKSKIYDLDSGEYIDYNPKYVFLNRFPTDYEPAAPAVESVDKFFTDITCGNKEIYNVMMEVIGSGYFLQNRYRGSAFLWDPDGGSGKSTLFNLLFQLFGPDNCSALTLQDFENKFRLMGIYGKAVNVGDDIPDSLIEDSSVFKKIATGQKITAEYKGQDPVDFIPYCTMFFSGNKVPPARDKTDAYLSRWVIVPMRANFRTADSRDCALKDKEWSEAELAYLTRLAMDGLQRVIRQNGFSHCAAAEEAKDDFQTENDPIHAFIDDYPADFINGKSVTSIYNTFNEWRLRSGIKTQYGQKKFTRKIKAVTGFDTKSIRNPYKDGTVETVYTSTMA